MPDPAPQGDRASRLNTSAPARASEPTLPELLSAAWRRSGALGRAALVALAVLAVAFAAWLFFGRSGGSFTYEGTDAPPFSISWSEMEKVEPKPGELLRLESDTETLTIEPLEFEARGDRPLSGLALDAEADDAVLEGRTELAVDRGPDAYQVAFTAPADEGIVIGKRFLVPDPDRPGEGVRIEITETTDDPPVIEKVSEAPAGFFGNWPIQLLLEDAASVRTEEGLEEPLRSFAFG